MRRRVAAHGPGVEIAEMRQIHQIVDHQHVVALDRIDVVLVGPPAGIVVIGKIDDLSPGRRAPDRPSRSTRAGPSRPRDRSAPGRLRGSAAARGSRCSARRRRTPDRDSRIGCRLRRRCPDAAARRGDSSGRPARRPCRCRRGIARPDRCRSGGRAARRRPHRPRRRCTRHCGATWWPPYRRERRSVIDDKAVMRPGKASQSGRASPCSSSRARTSAALRISARSPGKIRRSTRAAPSFLATPR